MRHTRAMRKLIVVSLYAVALSSLLVLFFLRPGVYEGPNNFVNMIYGTAERPFVRRALTPSAIRCLVVVSERMLWSTERDLSTHPVSKLGDGLMRVTDAPETARGYAHEYGVCLLVAAGCFIGFGCALRGLIRHFYPEYPEFVSDVVPIVGLLAIPLIFFHYDNYVYDPMTLLVFASCAYLIVKRRHLLYAVVFPLASLNKETAVLLILVFIVREIGAAARRRAALFCLWQLVVFALIQLWLVSVFRENPGSFVEFHLHRNATLLTYSGFYLKTLGVLTPITIIIAHRWREKPLFLRRSLVVCLGPLLVLAVFFGYLNELRGYYEVYPFVLLLMTPTLVEALGISSWPGASALPPADPRRHGHLLGDRAGSDSRSAEAGGLTSVCSRRAWLSRRLHRGLTPATHPPRQP